MDGLTATGETIPAGCASGGTVRRTDDIENALAAIWRHGFWKSSNFLLIFV